MSNEMLYVALTGTWLPLLFATACVWGSIMVVSNTIGGYR